MKRTPFALIALTLLAGLMTAAVEAAPITGLAWRDSTKAADTLLFRRGVAVNIVPTKSSAGTVDSFVITGVQVTLPAGITLNKTTGAISGTATSNFVGANRTIRAYSGTDIRDRTVRITVNHVTGLTYRDSTKGVDTVFLMKGTPATLTPTYNGFAGTTLTTWEVTSNGGVLPDSLTINPTTGVISGKPLTFSNGANHTIRAISTGGLDTVTRTLRLQIGVVRGLTWRDSTRPADTLIFRLGTAASFTPTYIGNGATISSYEVTGNNTELPPGITLNATTGVISGTATGVYPAANRTITATVSNGDLVTRTVRFAAVNRTSLAWVDSTKPADTLSLTTNVAFTRTPTWFGASVDSFLVIGAALPAGVTLNKTTGVLSGTPTAGFAAANRTLRAYGSAGLDSMSRTVRFTVTLGGTVGFGYERDTVSYVVGVNTTNNPVFTGRAPTTYSVTPALPAGLTLNPATGVITGRPTAAAAVANYTVSAVDTGATPDANLSRVVRFTVLASEDHNTAFSQHKTLWVNTATGMGGVAISANVTRYPVLVKLDATTFTGFAQTSPNRSDVRFTKSNNTTPLNFEIERWDSVGQIADIWVLLDTVYANNSTQNFRMHWGRSGVLTASSGRAVFDTAHGYRAVYHYTGTSNAVNENDATANAIVSSNRSTVDVGNNPDENDIVIGLSRDFNGTNEYFRLLTAPTGPLNFAPNGNYTISTWMKPGDDMTLVSGRTLVSKGFGQYGLQFTDSGKVSFFEYNNNSGTATGGAPATPWATQAVTSPTAAVAGVWSHVVAVSSGATKRLYVDGALVATNPGTAIANFTGASATAASTADSVTIARQSVDAAGYFTGFMDEVRFSGVARTADYVTLNYGNQRQTGQKLIAHALPVSVNGQLAGEAGKALSFKRSGEGILFQIQGSESARARITVLDTRGRIVWSRTVQTGAGLHEVSWNGVGNGGQAVSSGIYAARVTLLDGQNHAIRVMDAKLPMTR